MSLRQALVLAPLLVGGVVPAQVYAQEQKEEQEASAQLWGNVVLDFPKGDRFLLELDVQPKVQYAGTICAAGTLEFAAHSRISAIPL